MVKYASMEEKIVPKEDCFIGAGYNTCEDLGFQAVDLFNTFKEEIGELEREEPIKPQVHSQILDLRSFTETFLHFFSNGSNAEFVSFQPDIFFLVADKLEDFNIKVNSEIGGHSAVWALRAQLENCKAYIAALPTQFNIKKLRLSDHRGENLVFPHELIDAPEDVNRHKYQDRHFVLEYNKGDDILGFKAPRSNRFYFVHDPNGASLK